MLFVSFWRVDLVVLFITIIFLLYKLITRKFDYWKKKGVYFPKPVPFLGNFGEICIQRTTIGEWLQKLYCDIDEPYFGIFVFNEPYLIIKSPELVKQILIKESQYFADRTGATPKHNEIIANSLFFLKGLKWKTTRAKMRPVFTSGKLKGMFPLINNVGDELNDYLEKHLGNLEAKEVCAKYATDVIAKCAFGVNAHSFDNEDAEFRKIGRTMFGFSWRNAIAQGSYFFSHIMVDILHLDFVDRRSTDYLTQVLLHVVNEREKTGAKYNDLIDIIAELKKNKEFCTELDFTGEKVVFQAVQFFLAGFEGISTTVAFTLYELCKNPKKQTKLRNEIIANTQKNQGFTYEGLHEMKYLEQCILETLRMYPVLPFLDRTCNTDYKLPGTDLIIESGTPVYITVFGLHHDEQFFPQPKKYIPERFADEQYNQSGLYFLPFGGGPRICIGERFGNIASKLALVKILSKYEVERSPDTPEFIEFDRKSFILQSKIGFPMRFKKI